MASTILGLFLAELALKAVDRPPAHPVQVAHPANYREIRHNAEFVYEFKTNSMGIRNDEIPLSKPAGETRFFVLGDSYAEGYGLEQNRRFTSILEDRFGKEGRDFRLINGGLTGTGPLAYWKVMYKVGLEYNPDHIIICLFANDLSNMRPTVRPKDLNEFYYAYYDDLPPARRLFYRLFPRFYVLLSQAVENLPEYSQAAQANVPHGFLATIERYLEGHKVPREAYEAWKAGLDTQLLRYADQDILDWSVLAYPLLRPRYWFDALDIDSPSAEEKYRSMELVLDRMVGVAKERGINIGVAFLPVRYQYDPRAFDPNHPWVKSGMVDERWLGGTTEIQLRLRRWASERRVPFHDLTPRFREEASKGKPLNFKIDGHWNAAGHAIAADEIHNWMAAEDGLLATR